MKKLFPSWFKSEIKKNMLAGQSFVPHEHDVMLVSYPKSGNTWLRSLLCNLALDNPKLKDIDKGIPDIYTSTLKDIEQAVVFEFGGRVLKSHEAYRPFYNKTIYIYRDPRDVLISYYHYAKKRKLQHYENLTLNEFAKLFMEGKLDTYGTWYENVKSWMAMRDANLHLCSYEDFLENPMNELKKVVNFLGIDPSDERLKKAIDSSSIDSLRKKERSEKRSWKETDRLKNNTINENTSFFRSGESGQWESYEREIFESVEETWGALMYDLGYKVRDNSL